MFTAGPRPIQRYLNLSDRLNGWSSNPEQTNKHTHFQIYRYRRLIKIILVDPSVARPGMSYFFFSESRSKHSRKDWKVHAHRYFGNLWWFAWTFFGFFVFEHHWNRLLHDTSFVLDHLPTATTEDITTIWWRTIWNTIQWIPSGLIFWFLTQKSIEHSYFQKISISLKNLSKLKEILFETKPDHQVLHVCRN